MLSLPHKKLHHSTVNKNSSFAPFPPVYFLRKWNNCSGILCSRHSWIWSDWNWTRELDCLGDITFYHPPPTTVFFLRLLLLVLLLSGEFGVLWGKLIPRVDGVLSTKSLIKVRLGQVRADLMMTVGRWIYLGAVAADMASRSFQGLWLG